MYEIYYNALSANGGTAEQADAAVQAYVKSAGYPGVTTAQIDSAIQVVAGGNYSEVSKPGGAGAPTVTYPPFGTLPTVLYGTYQTFDTGGTPSLVVTLYPNGGTYQLQVATASTKQLVDITSSVGFNPNNGEFFVGSSADFPYNGSLTFSSCVVVVNGLTVTDFNVSVSLTPSSGGAAVTSTGRRNVYSSAAALAPAAVDSASLWAGTYTGTLNDTTQTTLVIAPDGSTVTFQGTTASGGFDPFHSSFQCTIGNQTLVLYMHWWYFQLYANDTYTGPVLTGYYYPTGSTMPSSPNVYGRLGQTPPPAPTPQEKADSVLNTLAVQLGIGVVSIIIFECLKAAATAGYNALSGAIQNFRRQGEALAENPANGPVEGNNANQFNAQDNPGGEGGGGEGGGGEGGGGEGGGGEGGGGEGGGGEGGGGEGGGGEGGGGEGGGEGGGQGGGGGEGGGGGGGCFLTTAVVNSLGMPDDCEPLTLARFIRDMKMTSPRERAAVQLYYKVAPRIVERSSEGEWHRFWARYLRQITQLTRMGEYELAKDLYTFATAELVDRKVTTFKDVDLVDEVYSYGLGTFARVKLPYALRFVILKLAFRVGLRYQSVRLWLLTRRLDGKHDL